VCAFLAVQILGGILGALFRGNMFRALDRALGLLFGIALGTALVLAVLLALRLQPFFDADALLAGSLLNRLAGAWVFSRNAPAPRTAGGGGAAYV